MRYHHAGGRFGFVPTDERPEKDVMSIRRGGTGARPLHLSARHGEQFIPDVAPFFFFFILFYFILFYFISVPPIRIFLVESSLLTHVQTGRAAFHCEHVRVFCLSLRPIMNVKMKNSHGDAGDHRGEGYSVVLLGRRGAFRASPSLICEW